MPQGITLLEYVLKTNSLNEEAARKIGKTLGSWLKEFTQWAASHTELRDEAAKNGQGQFFRHLVTFTWLKDRVEQYPAVLGDVKEVFAEVEQAVTAELKDSSKLQLIHGDFWTGK
jgi:fructosamine-3-kinase